MKLSRRTLIVIVAAALAAGAGLYMAGIIGHKAAPHVKTSPDPIPLALPFTINLADPDQTAYIRLGLAVQLKPMTESDEAMFMAGPSTGGHGGSKTDMTGPGRVAAYPKFRDAVIDVTSRFTSEQLLSASGKADLKKALLERFEQIASSDKPAHAGKGKEAVEMMPYDAPYNIEDVYFEEFAIQALVGG